MADVPAASDEGVGNQTAVAFVWQGFGAHDGCSLLLGGGHQVFEGSEEFCGLHIVGVGVERFDAPGGIGRIGQPLRSPAAQIDEMAVLDGGLGERGCERILIELRMPAGAREATDVGE